MNFYLCRVAQNTLGFFLRIIKLQNFPKQRYRRPVWSARRGLTHLIISALSLRYPLRLLRLRPHLAPLPRVPDERQDPKVILGHHLFEHRAVLVSTTLSKLTVFRGPIATSISEAYHLSGFVWIMIPLMA